MRVEALSQKHSHNRVDKPPISLILTAIHEKRACSDVPHNNAVEQAFIELNVFDNGPGLASKWLGKSINDVSIQEEWEAVQSCWAKYATTSDMESKGLGLFRVAQTLTECKGFLRVRTGRLSLYRDFSKSPYPDRDVDPADNLFSPKRPMLMDFKTRSVIHQTSPSFTPCEGLLLTMLIPMKMLVESAENIQ